MSSTTFSIKRKLLKKKKNSEQIFSINISDGTE